MCVAFVQAIDAREEKAASLLPFVIFGVCKVLYFP